MLKPFEPVPVDMKIGILHTIANSIYASTEGKIREAVANAMDNKASWFIIMVDPTANKISLLDNGSGITENRFKQIFSILGLGLSKFDHESLSYFGLGLMSIIRLGKRAKIYTHTVEINKTMIVKIDAEKIFDRINEDKGIGFLSECIEMAQTDMDDREANSPISMADIVSLAKTSPRSFTEIVIEEVNQDDLNIILGKDFENDIRKLLPLRPENDDPFIERITDVATRQGVLELLTDTRYCKTIDVYFGIYEEPIRQLWKYFPNFRRELGFGEANVEVGRKDDFAYYYLYTSEDLEERGKPTTETGFWIRNKNFLVKAADNMQPPNSRKKILDEPLRNWLYGEIFHKDMNEFLIVARNDYIWKHPKFEEFRSQVKSLTSHLNERLRKAWKYVNIVSNAVITPFNQIHEPTGPFRRTADTLSKMGIAADGADADDILEKISQKRKPEIEILPKITDLLKKDTKKIPLYEDDELLVSIDKKVISANHFSKTWDGSKNKVIISISPTLFSSKAVVFLGRAFDLHFVAGKDDQFPISVNKDNSQIFVNPFNKDLLKFNVSFIDVIVAIEIADSMSADKLEMKHYLLALLGKDVPESGKYIGSLGDELQRKRVV